MDDLLLLDLRAPQALGSEVPPNTSHLAVRPEIKVVFALKCIEILFIKQKGNNASNIHHVSLLKHFYPSTRSDKSIIRSKRKSKKVMGAFSSHKFNSYKVWTPWADALAQKGPPGSSFLSWFLIGARRRSPAFAR